MPPDLSALRTLFTDPDMFDSRDDFRRAGFDVHDRSSDNKIMVGSHKAAPGVLFKKYSRAISGQEQRENYERRVDGARRVRELIAARGLCHVVVPGKWILDLPRTFGSRDCLLVAERLKLVDDDATERLYERIDDDVLRELCIVLQEFRGLDSWFKNLPFTKDGTIAFIDTEHWHRRKHGKEPLRKLDLPRSARRFVERFFDR